MRSRKRHYSEDILDNDKVKEGEGHILAKQSQHLPERQSTGRINDGKRH